MICSLIELNYFLIFNYIEISRCSFFSQNFVSTNRKKNESNHCKPPWLVVMYKIRIIWEDKNKIEYGGGDECRKGAAPLPNIIPK